MKKSDNFIRVTSFDNQRSFVIDLLDVPPALRKRIYHVITSTCSSIDNELSARIVGVD